MPNYAPHALLAWGGTLFGTEQWVNTLRFSSFAASFLDYDAALTDIVADLRLFHGTSRFHNQCTVDWVKFNRINETGHYADGSKTNVRYLEGTTGANAQIKGTGTVYTAPQLAYKATFRTARQRGAGSRGGFYLSGLNSFGVVTADGRVSDAVANDFKNATATLLNNLNNWPGIDWLSGNPEIVIASQGGRNEPAPFNEKVTGVTFGRVIDTQRRGRNRLVEDYVAPAAVA